MPCENALRLVPAYLDGELSDEQAAPLRQHLLDCHACREAAKAGRTLQRWFVSGDAAPVPEGFAARVARRAFAGDPGLLEPAAPLGPAAVVLPFVLTLTALAAGLLFVLSIALHQRSLPSDRGLAAETGVDLEQLLREESGLEGPAAPFAGLPPEDEDADESGD